MQLYQRHQVPWVLATKLSTAAENDERHKEDGVGHIVRPPISPYKHFDVSWKGENGNKREGDQQLHSQDQKHLRREWRNSVYLLHTLFIYTDSVPYCLPF